MSEDAKLIALMLGWGFISTAWVWWPAAGIVVSFVLSGFVLMCLAYFLLRISSWVISFVAV